MDINIRYVVYRLRPVMESDRHLALDKVEFRGIVSNWFETEEDAVRALITDNLTYQEYVILKQVYIN